MKRAHLVILATIVSAFIFLVAGNVASAETEIYTGTVSFSSDLEPNKDIVLPKFDTTGDRVLDSVTVQYLHRGSAELAADNDDDFKTGRVNGRVMRTWSSTGPGVAALASLTAAASPEDLAVDNGDDGLFDATPPDGHDFGTVGYAETDQNGFGSPLLYTPGTSSYESAGPSTVTFAVDVLTMVNDHQWVVAPDAWQQEVQNPILVVTCTVTYEYTSTPTMVELASLKANSVPGGIRVDWETGSELGNFGFNVYRSESAEGEPVLLTASLIPAKQAGLVGGASYSFVDRDVTPGQTYWYWLEGVSAFGSDPRHGPVSAVAAANAAPENVSISADWPSSRPWQPVEFTCTFSDPDGWQDIRFAEVLINDRANGRSGIWLRYYPATGRTLLRIPDVGRWQRLRGDPPTRMNRSAIVELGDVFADGETLQITYRIKPKGTFLGDWNLYLRARDMGGAQAGFDDMGDWSVAR